MLWLYLTGAAILVGGEVNSEVEDAAAKAGAPDAKEKGEKAPEEREEKRFAPPPQQRAAASAVNHPSAPRRHQSGRRKGLTLGTVATVFGAWCLGLLQRATKKTSTIHRE